VATSQLTLAAVGKRDPEDLEFLVACGIRGPSFTIVSQDTMLLEGAPEDPLQIAGAPP
jgi:hypothetical protein